MSKRVKLRNVPDELHRKIKARAAMLGMSLSEYLLQEIQEIPAKPTLMEMMERLKQRSSVQFKSSLAEAFRDEREKS